MLTGGNRAQVLIVEKRRQNRCTKWMISPSKFGNIVFLQDWGFRAVTNWREYSGRKA